MVMEELFQKYGVLLLKPPIHNDTLYQTLAWVVLNIRQFSLESQASICVRESSSSLWDSSSNYVVWPMLG